MIGSVLSGCGSDEPIRNEQEGKARVVCNACGGWKELKENPLESMFQDAMAGKDIDNKEYKTAEIEEFAKRHVACSLAPEHARSTGISVLTASDPKWRRLPVDKKEK